MKSMRNAPRRLAAAAQKGVMLVEALVAILISSVGIIAVMGMQAASITQVTQSKFRTDASYLANQIVGRMWGDIANLDSYEAAGFSGRQNWDATVANTLPSGTGAIDVVGDQVTVTITWRMPEDPTTTRRYVTVARINRNPP
jgi:type IV pilus assembly protein PilV